MQQEPQASKQDRILSEQDVHEILRNERRRAVIQQLQRTIGEASLRTLAERIAEYETGESPPPRNIRQSVYNSLHQTHLPKLDRQGIIDYDKNRKSVSLRRDAREVNPYMDVFLFDSYRFTWAEYYRSVAVIGFLTLLAVEIGTPIVSAIDSVLWASLFLVAVALSTAYQLRGYRWVLLDRLFGGL
ncbi:hypothetical protein EGH21_14980 [Halomicroarcula sp. F13]|uniref:DUF7344 domain-containing protein n=1 Tax=Haloarcula rubra TaxID=2487747 RepID=A0AAW4PT65_9EURY|nr:hypothetical protein [Halomicroarcula rubra]MBX0324332.1 hypothetical protein [Halomicroarcula rubra]